MWYPLLFALCALAAVVSALVVVLQRRAFYSGLALSVTLLATAGLFALLGASFLAVIQVLVYAGAILVLFLFVVWLLGVYREADVVVSWRRALWWLAGVVMATGTLIAALFLFAKYTGTGATQAGVGGPRAFALSLFERFIYPFELTSFLFLVAIVAALYLSRPGSRA